MTFNELRKKEGKISGLVALERHLSRKSRAKEKEFLLLVTPLLMMFLLFFEEHHFVPPSILYGFMCILVSIWCFLFMIDCFYYAHYFRAARISLPEWGIVNREKDHGSPVPYEVLEIISHTEPSDLAGGFLSSKSGLEILERLGIVAEIAASFETSDRQRVYAESVSFPEPLTLVAYTERVFDADQEFAKFLAVHGVSRKDLALVASWVAYIHERDKEAHRWWGRDSLGRIRGWSKDWAWGSIANFGAYGTFVEAEGDDIIFKKEIDHLERILAREAGADALLIGPDPDDLQAVLTGFAARISDGSVLPPIQHKRILLLDSAKLSLAMPNHTSGVFENRLTRLFNQVHTDGHIILVIPNLDDFIAQGKENGVDIAGLLSSYMSSPYFQLIAFTEKSVYEKSLKSNPELIKHFENVFVETEEKEIIIRVLQHRIYDIERLTHLYFTERSLSVIAAKPQNVAEALENFNKLVPELIQKKIHTVTAADLR